MFKLKLRLMLVALCTVWFTFAVEAQEQKPLDLMLLIDRSASVGEENFNLMKSFLQKLVARLEIGRSQTRVGVVSFFQGPRIDIPLGKHTNVESLQNAIAAIEFDSKGPRQTQLANALKQLRNDHFNGRDGDRPGVRNIAVIITDGKLLDFQESKSEVIKVRDRNVRVIPVGVAGVKKKNIEDLSEFPKKQDENYFIAETFKGLDEKLADAIIEIFEKEKPTLITPDNRTIPEVLETETVAPEVFVVLKEKVPVLKKLIAQFYGFKVTPVDAESILFDDMILGPSLVQFFINGFQDLLQNQTRKKRAIIDFSKMPQTKWLRQDFPIKYVLGNYIASDENILEEAIEQWRKYTCIPFVRIQPDDPAIRNENGLIFWDGTKCSSNVGKNDEDVKFQYIRVASKVCKPLFGVTVHEIGHALGLFHEQNRPDSSQFITLVDSNIKSDHANFRPFCNGAEGCMSFSIPYDYNSIMHYASINAQFSVDQKAPTILTNDRRFMKNIGQRVGLSFYDIKIANLEYCKDKMDKCTNLKCKQGGIPNPKFKCTQCICPDGFTGDTCSKVGPNDEGCSPKGNDITVTSSETCLTSPGYNTGGYTSKTQCNWKLKSPPKTKIAMWFTDDFGLYCVHQVCYHWIEIKYKPTFDQSGPRFCCDGRPNVKIVTEGNEAIVIFRSNFVDDDVQKDQTKGFRLCYKIDGEDVVTKTTDATTTDTTPGIDQTPGTPTSCKPNPCKNKGRCKGSSSKFVSCKCKKGFFGVLCENKQVVTTPSTVTATSGCQPTFVLNTDNKCIATCNRPKPPRTCPNPPPCICPKKTFLFLKKCVKSSKCRCLDLNNKIKQEKDTWLSNNCKTIFTCKKRGQVTQNSHKCSSDERCDGKGNCVPKRAEPTTEVPTSPTTTQGSTELCPNNNPPTIYDYNNRNAMNIRAAVLNPREDAKDVLLGSGKDISFITEYAIAMQHTTAFSFIVWDVKFTVIGAANMTVLLSVDGSSSKQLFPFDLKFNEFNDIELSRGKGLPANGLGNIFFVQLEFVPSDRQTTVKVSNLRLSVCPE